MAKSQAAAFVKFFSEEAHADQFVKGHLYMRKLRHFQQLENGEGDDGRPDPNEGVVSWHQPDRVELKLEFPGIKPVVIGKDELAGPVSISRSFYSDMHVFCMTTLSIPDSAKIEGGHEEVQDQLQAAFQVDEGCLGFGTYSVIVSVSEFLPKLRRALRKSDYWFRADAVQYYDETTFHGDFDVEEAPFRKQSKFAYQNEYRICLQVNTDGDDPITFDVGDISPFAIKIKSSDLNTALKVTLRSPSD